jgi:hypothetical protein
MLYWKSTKPYQLQYARKLWLENENLAEGRVERDDGDEDENLSILVKGSTIGESGAIPDKIVETVLKSTFPSIQATTIICFCTKM